MRHVLGPHRHLIRCEHYDTCVAEFLTDIYNVLPDGWRGDVGGLKHWCTEHARTTEGLPGCEFCGQPMRPQGWKKDTIPGSVASSGGVYCSTHREATRWYLQGEVDRAVETYWKKRGRL